MIQKKLKKIVVLTTGGTIAGLSNDPQQPQNYQAAALSGQALLQHLAINAQEVELDEVARIDSKDMGESVWRELLARAAHHLSDDSVQALVITHGSDTIEETAFLLQAMLRPTKPVVLTCAMRAANHPQADGPRNFDDAMWLAQSSDEWAGVWVVCASEVHAPMEVYKAHSHRLNAFASAGGCVARIKSAEIELLKPRPEPVFQTTLSLDALLKKKWPHVEVIFNHADARGDLLRLLIIHQHPKAVLIVGTGNATVSESLQQAINEAQGKGVMLDITSRCTEGGVTSPPSDSPIAAAGNKKTNPLSWPQARLALMLRWLEKN